MYHGVGKMLCIYWALFEGIKKGGVGSRPLGRSCRKHSDNPSRGVVGLLLAVYQVALLWGFRESLEKALPFGYLLLEIWPAI